MVLELFVIVLFPTVMTASCADCISGLNASIVNLSSTARVPDVPKSNFTLALDILVAVLGNLPLSINNPASKSLTSVLPLVTVESTVSYPRTPAAVAPELDQLNVTSPPVLFVIVNLCVDESYETA